MSNTGDTPLLELSIASKAFPDRRGTAAAIVKNLYLSIGRGEFVCLIGPSGCGKTTILKILLGLDRDFEGWKKPDPQHLSVGVVFQEPRLLPWRTVEENVRIALPPDQRQRNLDELFFRTGLAPWRNHYPRALSLGLARRAAIVRALAAERDLLVLDEPFVSLDDQAAKDLRDFVRTSALHTHVAVLMVTHNLREAVEMADRLVFLQPSPTCIDRQMYLTEPWGNRSSEWIESQYRHIVSGNAP